MVDMNGVTRNAFSMASKALRARKSLISSNRSRSMKPCVRHCVPHLPGRPHKLQRGAPLTSAARPLRLPALLRPLLPPSPLPPPPRPPEAILQSKHCRKHKKAKESPTKASSDPEDGANAFIDDPIHELPDTRGQTGKAAPRSPLGRTPVRAFASPPAALTPPVIHTTSKEKPPEPSQSSPTKASVEPENENNAFIDDPLYDLFGILGPTGKAAPR